MSNTESLNQIFVEIIKLVISGAVGGLIASWFNYLLLRAQKRLDTKYELQKRKLDALRDLISTLHWIHRDMLYNREKSIIKDEDEYMIEFVNKTNYWETLFLDDKDMSAVIDKFNTLVYVSKETISGKRKTSKKELMQAINQIRVGAMNKIVELQKS